MPKSTSLSVYLLLFVLPVCTNAAAATYKCIDANGDVTYSQSPCKQNQKTDKLLESAKKPAEMEDCKYAGAFSQLAFRQMRAGASTQQLFDRYGGVNSISRSTLGIINYVYSFKYSTTVQSDRVARLTIAKCNAQAFGKVSCEDFPREFQEMIFSCDEEERKEALRLQKLFDQRAGQRGQFNNSANVGAYGSNNNDSRNQERIQAEKQKRKEREQARIIKCKNRYQSKINRIDDRLSQGYTPSQGESLRDRRRSLIKRLAAECQ